MFLNLEGLVAPLTFLSECEKLHEDDEVPQERPKGADEPRHFIKEKCSL